MAFKDLREFIDRLEEEGELLRIDEEVDWNLEVGGIGRRATQLKEPALLFQNIKDYPRGYRILSEQNGPSKKPGRYYTRIAMAMAMDPDSSFEDIVQEYIKRKNTPQKPVLVATGPCKNNIQSGEEVDLESFPVPLIHEGDGGRYIGTWHIVATKDPDTGWVNWGTYRLMVHDKKTMGGVLVPIQHIGRMYYQKYEARGLPMEFAAVIGSEPITPLIGCTAIPPGVNEVDVIGGIRQEPLQLVKCETVELEVPATSEIVIEGEILPNERKEEGPFGEYVGYRASERSPKPVYHVKAITYRNDPIIPMCALGTPVDEGHLVSSVSASAEILEDLRNREFPVRMVHIPPESSCHMTIVSTKIPYPNFAKKIANAIWASGQGILSYYLVVVNDDIDVTDLNQVLWALTTRCHPDRGVFKETNAPAYPILLPFLPPKDRLIGNRGTSILFDCTWPYDWSKEDIPKKASFDVLWPKELQQTIMNKWRNYGFEG